MKLPLADITVAFGLMTGTAVNPAIAAGIIVDSDVSIDFEGGYYFEDKPTSEYSIPYVGVQVMGEYLSWDWAYIKQMLETPDTDPSFRSALVQACKMLKEFKADHQISFAEYNINAEISLPPDWYNCEEPVVIGQIKQDQNIKSLQRLFT